jgi:hypothetical protein
MILLSPDHSFLATAASLMRVCYAIALTLRGFTAVILGKPPIPSGEGFMTSVCCEYDRKPRIRPYDDQRPGRAIPAVIR